MNKQEILKRLQALELKVKKLEIEAELKKLEGPFVGSDKYPGYGPLYRSTCKAIRGD